MSSSSDVNVLLLRAAGINCDREAESAFRMAGATSTARIHINALAADPAPIHDAQILMLPGGFSYGDDIASGRILAVELRRKLRDAVERFLADGKLLLGVCNGFQVLVTSGLLPGGANGLRVPARQRQITLTHNTRGQFECRWVTLRVPEAAAAKSPFLKGLTTLRLPVAHAEGRLVGAEPVLDTLSADGQIGIQYVDPATGEPTQDTPHNPNGAARAIAGLLDSTGRVFGLMPHPERAVLPTHVPGWTAARTGGESGGGTAIAEEGPGLAIFRNAVEYARESLS